MSRLTFTNLETFKGVKTWESQTNRLGESSVGVFRLKDVYADFYLYSLKSYEVEHFNYVKLNANEKLFRYETETTKIGNMMPLIKVNMKSGLVYFLDNTTESHMAVFHKKSSKPIFIDINLTQK